MALVVTRLSLPAFTICSAPATVLETKARGLTPLTTGLLGLLVLPLQEVRINAAGTRAAIAPSFKLKAPRGSISLVKTVIITERNGELSGRRSGAPGCK